MRREDSAKKCQDGVIELFRPLQRREVAYAGEVNKFATGKGAGKIFGMFALNEFIMLAVNDRNRNVDPGQIVRRKIRLCPLHEADCLGKLAELIRGG